MRKKSVLVSILLAFGLIIGGGVAAQAVPAQAAPVTGTFTVAHGTATATGSWVMTPATLPWPHDADGFSLTGQLTVNGGGGCYQVHLWASSATSHQTGEFSPFLCGRGSLSIREPGNGNILHEIRICRYVAGAPVASDCGPPQVLNGSASTAPGAPPAGAGRSAAPARQAITTGTYGISHAGNTSSGTWRSMLFVGTWLSSVSGRLTVTSGCAYLDVTVAGGAPSGRGTRFVQCGAGSIDVAESSGGQYANVRLCSMVSGGAPDGRNCGSPQRIG